MKFDGSINSVDCATAWAAPASMRPDILMTGVLGPVEVPISSTAAAVTVDSLVFKSGRTTEGTCGRRPGEREVWWRMYVALWVRLLSHKVTGMSLRLRMRQALPEAMRARDKVAVSTLRATLAALDNAEAVPVDEAELRGVALEQSPVGVGTTEAVRRELSERRVVEIVRAEAAERLDAAAQLSAPAHADRAARLRTEAALLHRFLEDSRTA